CAASASGSSATILLSRISRSFEASSITSNVAHVTCRASASLAKEGRAACAPALPSLADRDAIMPSLLHSRDERFCLRINHRLALVGTRELFYRVHGIEPKQRDEFHFVAVLADEQLSVAITLDLSRGDARKNLIAQQFLVCLRVCGFCPPVPNACDHRSFCW